MTPETIAYIRAHRSEDVRLLALRGSKADGVDMPSALEQIAGWQKAREKLPSWAAAEGIVYPPRISMEQCSSEATARYKAAIAVRTAPEGTAEGMAGDCFVDLTGGFGVDFYYIGALFRRAVYVERQPRLCAVAKQNFERLGGLAGCEVVNADGQDYLDTLGHADLIFLDPARRDANGRRTYGIGDCTPDVRAMLPQLAAKGEALLLKLSPMLDWRKAVEDIEAVGCARVREVHIVATDNEVKELLLLVSRHGGPVEVYCACDGALLRYYPQEEAAARELPVAEIPSAPRYLYEPNSAVMKAGCYRLIGARYGVAQLGANSHLYVSEQEVADFPGRRFEITGMTDMGMRSMKEALKGITHANISVRNFPMSAEELRRKLRLKDGGDTYIFATTIDGRGHQIIIGRKKS